MLQKDRGRISGVFPRLPEPLSAQPILSINEILRVIGHSLDCYDSKKTFAVIAPRDMERDEALALLKKGRYCVEDIGQEIQISISRE